MTRTPEEKHQIRKMRSLIRTLSEIHEYWSTSEGYAGKIAVDDCRLGRIQAKLDIAVDVVKSILKEELWDESPDSD